MTPGCERFTTTLSEPAHRLSVAHFENGELHLQLPVEVRDRPCVVFASVSPPAGNVERLTLISHALTRAGAAGVTAVLPYLAYARQDVATDSESLGLEWLGTLLRAAGVSAMVTIDVHSARAGRLLGLPLRSLSPAALMARALMAGTPGGGEPSEVTFVAPDEGARERCRAVADAVGSRRPIVWIRKRRTASGIVHLGIEGEPGPRAVVVDDILDTGGTLISCCERLHAAGVQRIELLVTHGLFTGDRWRALVERMVQEVWLTDTVMAHHRPPTAHVIPTATLLSQSLTQPGD